MRTRFDKSGGSGREVSHVLRFDILPTLHTRRPTSSLNISASLRMHLILQRAFSGRQTTPIWAQSPGATDLVQYRDAGRLPRGVEQGVSKISNYDRHDGNWASAPKSSKLVHLVTWQ